MAEDQGGQRNLPQMAWLKLFTAFKVALDPKKLLLAGGGILMMALGWWVLSWGFFSAFASNRPKVEDYVSKKAQAEKEQQDGFRKFQAARASWNLMYALAGPAPENIDKAPRKDAGDLAATLAEYEALESLRARLERTNAPVAVVVTADASYFELNKERYAFKADKGALVPTAIRAGDVRLVDPANGQVILGAVAVTVDEKKVADLQKSLAGIETAEQIALTNPGKRELVAKAVALATRSNELILPFGKLRTLPWSEYRGPNPVLYATGDVKVARTKGWLDWFWNEQIPVVLEPLCKLMEPVKSFLRPAAGLREKTYLLLVILWTLLTWGLFGGAITRMAAVQVARQNEKVGMVEAFRFARGRLRSFFFAPILPLFFLAFITFLLVLFGWFEGFTWAFGDLITGLFWPMILIGGLVMAAILVGLVGWPLMHATISTEGSDSFDALSRSYSYVYQAPWHYAWYALVAVAYGAVLIFFVGFMGSLFVYMAKWGVATAKLPSDREPTYFFAYAPTSFGWRDLMLKQAPPAHVKVERRLVNTGEIIPAYGFTEDYEKTISWNNRIGIYLVAFWLGVVFLLVVGFGYSYFWTSATIIYLLLRRRVDDTELDEVHLEEEEEEPFAPEPPPPAPEAGKQTAAVTMVESPTLRTPDGAPALAETPPPPPADSPPPPLADGSPPPGGI